MTDTQAAREIMALNGWAGLAAGVCAASAILLAGLTRVASAEGGGARLFRVEAYGAAAGADKDSGTGIRKAIAAAVACGEPARVVLRAGVYRVRAEPDQRSCFLLDGADGLVVQGVKGKTEIVVTDPTKGCFRLRRCRNTWLRGIAIDYHPPPFTQGRVVAVDARNGKFDLEIQEGFPLLSEPWFARAEKRWGMPIHPTERRLKSGGIDHIFMDSWEHLGGRKFRLSARKGRAWRVRGVTPGDRWVQLARLVGAGGVGIWRCRDSGLEDVTVMASPSVAASVVGSEGIVVRRLSVCYRPGSKRLLTTDADGIHCPANRRGPLIEGCLFEGMADDSVNIYCRPSFILEKVSPRKIVVSGGVLIEPGDRLQIIDPRTGRFKAEVKAVESKWRNRRIHLTLDAAVPGLTAGQNHRDADTLCNLDASGEGYIIRNNVMRYHRRHGLLLRAGKGLVEGNRFERLAGLGIVVTNEPGWPEGPLARDVVIRNNTVVGCGYANYGPREDGGMIQVRAARLDYRLAAGHGQRRITIEGNTIIDPLRVGVYIGSAEDVKIIDNTIKASAGAPARGSSAGVVLANCGKIRIDKLTVVDPRPIAKAGIRIMRSVDPGKAGVTVSNIMTDFGGHEGADLVDERSK